MNIVLLGAIIKSMGLERIDWLSILRENTKAEFLKTNIKAIKCGIDFE